MPRINTLMHVTHSQYYLAELGGIDAVNPGMYRGFNGLISAHEFLAIVMTGTESGVIGLAVEWRESEPPLELDHWDEIVDVSMNFPDDDAAVFGPFDNDSKHIPLLPSGSYRVRAHARGRDEGRSHPVYENEGVPVEQHLLIAWPAPVAPELTHKLTDNYGAEIRNR